MSLLVQIPLFVLFWPPKPPVWMTAAGATLLAAGVVLNVWAERLFRRGGVGVCPFTPAPRLIASGPYRLTRNPMYLGMVFLSAGAALVSGVALNLLAAVVYLLWLHYRFVLPEEAFLLGTLGPTYAAYQVMHPRWIGLPTTRPLDAKPRDANRGVRVNRERY